jgi:hypothetical protein
MSQSPLARSTRKSLPAFAHPPSRLSKSTSIQNLRSNSEVDSPSPSPNPERHTTPTNAKGRYKDVSSSTTPVSTPTLTRTQSGTPKIMYSPYATSSPHAGPSRSASIPFDMAASARDARRKSIGLVRDRDREETPNLGGVGDEGEEMSVKDSSNKRRKAIMRKKPLFTR